MQRRKVRIYLKSGAVLKMRVKEWKFTTSRITGQLEAFNFEWSWWHNRRPTTIRVDDVSAIVVSRW